MLHKYILRMYSVAVNYYIQSMLSEQLSYLKNTSRILTKIESFEQYFSDSGCTPEYQIAWEKNRSHGIALNYLKPESALLVHNLVMTKKPLTVLEIGTGGAYSTLVIGDALAQLNNGGHIYTIEKSTPKIEIARVHIAESELGNITLIEGDANEILKQEIITKVDILFIDAARKHYKDFLIMCEPMLNVGAFIIADNINSHPEDVQDFLSYIKDSGKYDSEIVSIGSGLLIATITQALS